jgi:hypothetical protein
MEVFDHGTATATRLPIDWNQRDPVAVTAAAWRLHTTDPDFVSKYPDLFSIAVITDQDRSLAQEIRKYYQDLILMQLLAGQKVSEFRRKLYGFLTGRTQLLHEDIGLLYKLPYFYHHDQDLLSVVAQSTSVQSPQIQLGIEMTLTPLLTTQSHEIQTRGMQYWWLNHNNEAVRFCGGESRALTALIGGLWRRPSTTTFHGDYRTLQKSTMGNHLFWDVVSAELLY